MYYKLPIKERMELMKSYRKANPDMSYRDMVNDYNASYEKFEDGGKKDNTNVVINKGLPIKSLEELKKESDKIIAQKKMLAALKSKDYAKEKTNYEETTRGANQMDGSGISSAELGWRYAKLTDPTFVSGAAEVIKDAYMGNKQNMLNLAGAIPIPYLSGASKFAKNVRKYYYLDKVGDITNKGQDIVQEFGNGGVKERDPIYVTDKNDPRIRAYNDSLNIYNFNKQALNKIINENKTPKGKVLSNEKPEYLSKNKTIKANYADFLDFKKRYPSYALNYTEQDIKKELEAVDPINKGTGKKNYATHYYRFKDYKGEHVYDLAQYKKPVQPYIYKKPEEKESSKTVVHTDKALFDKAYKAEMDSLYLYKHPKPIQSPTSYDYGKTNPLINAKGMRSKGIDPVSWSRQGDEFFANWKKPVVHNVYQPPIELPQDTIKPAIKDTVKQKPIVDNVDSGLTRRWNFNASNPTLEYYDKSNKLVRSEYYKNMNDFKQGKQIKQ